MTGMMLEPTHAGPGKPVRHYTVQGGGGVTLRAREWGNSEGPGILFVHGWSQCDLCWRRCRTPRPRLTSPQHPRLQGGAE